MKKVRIVCLIIVVFMLATFSAGAEENEKMSVKVSGLAFGDFYWFADSSNPDYRNEYGFWIRRIFLGFNANLTHGFSAGLRFEMNQPDSHAQTPGTMIPYVKDAWLQYAFSGQKAAFGMMPTPSFPLVETWWGYRFVEKTLPDLQKTEQTRDIGVSMKGNILKSGVLQYQVMYGNGNGSGSEIDDAKTIYAALQVYPQKNLVIEVFGRYSGMDGSGTYTTAGHLFLGYRNDIMSAGAQYYVNVTEAGTPWMGLSLFGDVSLAEKWALFLRTDILFDGTYDKTGATKIPYLPFDDSAESSYLLVVGVDFNPIDTVHISPNFEAVFNVNGSGRNTYVPRLTAFWSF